MRNFQGMNLNDSKHIRRFSNLHLCTLKIFTLSSGKTDINKNIGEDLRRKSSSAHLPPALQVSANLIQGTILF